MKKIYLINLSFGLAGIERRFANLWHILHNRGNVDPVLVIPAELAAILQRSNLLPEKPGSVIVIPEPGMLSMLGRLPLNGPLKLMVTLLRSRVAALNYRPVWQKVKQERDSMVHVGMNCSALNPPSVPTVYECVDSTLTQLRTRHFRRASTKRCVVHCQTTRIQTALDTMYADRPTRWKTVTNPTYFAHYEANPGDVDRNPNLIAYVGRFSPEKNPVLFLRALAEARRRGCDCSAVVLGEGPLLPEMNEVIREHGLESHVEIGFNAKPFNTLRYSALYVSLQTGDNFGSQSLLEAMGAGCAIIASDVGETSKIISDDVGVRVPISVEAVADAIVRLLGSRERTREMGKAAEEFARTKFSADNYAAFVESLYQLAVQHYTT